MESSKLNSLQSQGTARAFTMPGYAHTPSMGDAGAKGRPLIGWHWHVDVEGPHAHQACYKAGGGLAGVAAGGQGEGRPIAWPSLGLAGWGY